MKNAALQWLSRDPLLHVCMSESIRRGHAEILYAGQDGVLLRDCCWIAFDQLRAPLRAGAKIRSAAQEAPCEVFPLPDGGVKVLFDTPQRAPAPGQSCVLYQGEYVLGGGYIQCQIPKETRPN